MKKKHLVILFIIALALLLFIETTMKNLGISTAFPSPAFWISKIVVFMALFFVLRKIMLENSKKVIGYLFENLDPEKFIEATLMDIKNIRNPKFKDILKLNLSAGYIYSGDFDSAEEIFKTVNLDNFSDIHKLLYYNNYISLLIAKDEYEDAISMYHNHADILGIKVNNPELNTSTLATKASILLYEGKFDESKTIFEDTMKTNQSNLSLLSTKMFLGILEHKEGNNDKAIDLLSYVANNSGKTILSTQAKKYLDTI